MSKLTREQVETIIRDAQRNRQSANLAGADLSELDLFAGAGGLSEGFLQAGFRSVAHVEMNEYAAKTLETRSAYYYLKNTGSLALYKNYLSGKISREEFMKQIPACMTKTVINETLSDESLPAVFKTIDGIMKIRGIKTIDVVVGGPPCQAYSLIGRAQSSHMETPMEHAHHS